MKTCNRCKLELPLTSFAKHATRKDGLQAECRTCMKARVFSWRATARGKALQLATDARYRKGERGKETKKSYRQTEAMKAARKRWKESPAGKAYAEAYRKSKMRKTVEKKYSVSPKGRAAQKRASSSDKGKARLTRAIYKRRKLLASCISTLTGEEWRAIQEAQGHRCHYCKREMKRLTVDHVIPVSKGGNHTKENIVGACRSCNSSKGAKLLS